MKDLLTRKEVASKLQLGIRTIDNLVATNGIPFLKIRRSVRFCPDQLQEWVSNTRKNVPVS